MVDLELAAAKLDTCEAQLSSFRRIGPAELVGPAEKAVEAYKALIQSQKQLNAAHVEWSEANGTPSEIRARILQRKAERYNCTVEDLVV